MKPESDGLMHTQRVGSGANAVQLSPVLGRNILVTQVARALAGHVLKEKQRRSVSEDPSTRHQGQEYPTQSFDW